MAIIPIVVKYGQSSVDTIIFDHATKRVMENVANLTVEFFHGERFYPQGTMTLISDDDGTEYDVAVEVIPNFDALEKDHADYLKNN